MFSFSEQSFKEYIWVFFGFVLIKYNLYAFLFVNFISVVIFKSSSYNARICQTKSNFSGFSSGSVVFSYCVFRMMFLLIKKKICVGYEVRSNFDLFPVETYDRVYCQLNKI